MLHPSQLMTDDLNKRWLGRLTRLNPGADTTALEQEIDANVCRLYGLTKDEIKLVEESTRR